MRSELKVSSRPSEDDVTKGKAFIIKFFLKIIIRCMFLTFLSMFFPTHYAASGA